MLTVERLFCGYGATEILHGVSIAVGPGRIVSLIGPNGAGKSTVMKAVFGLATVTGGDIRFDGATLLGAATEEIIHSGIAFVPQTANIFPSLSVAENLEMGGFAGRGDVAAGIERVFALFPALKEKRRHAGGSLSGGQRQMLAIGRAMISEPRLVLLDEPTAGLSPKVRDQIFEIVLEIRRDGTPVLMVEQNARAALAISDHAYVLVDGRNRIDATGAALLGDPEVAALFLGGQR